MPRVSKAPDAAIHDLYVMKRRTIREVAERLNLSYDLVAGRLRRNRWYHGKCKGDTHPQAKTQLRSDIRKLYKHYSVPDIARILGVSKVSVYHLLRRMRLQAVPHPRSNECRKIA